MSHSSGSHGRAGRWKKPTINRPARSLVLAAVCSSSGLIQLGVFFFSFFFPPFYLSFFLFFFLFSFSFFSLFFPFPPSPAQPSQLGQGVGKKQKHADGRDERGQD